MATVSQVQAMTGPTILVSPAEPACLRAIGASHSLPESYGVDFLAAIPGGRLAGIQRKEFPGDLLSSIDDGRLALDLIKMQSLDYRILLLEGRGQWTSEGGLLDSHKRFTRGRLMSLTLSCQLEHGCAVVTVEDQDQTIVAVPEIFRWLARAPHDSLRTRPKCPNPFLGGGSKLWQSWLMQAFPRCGPAIADRVVDHFGMAPLGWICSRGDLTQVPGVGKKLADAWLTCLPAIGGQHG
jgi:ERCC4-type nuclease